MELSDIDVLSFSVRNQESRRLIGEAITAYRGGALRAALISTWIAVTYDIIAKTRELAGQGEVASIKFIKEVDNAIEHKGKQKLQKIENELLTTANDKLQLLLPHEHEGLLRLQRDRHQCAHPAFITENELYQPSPELVRAHIVHALQYLLIHAPLQGKPAIARFETDLLSPFSPQTSSEIGVFVQKKYLERAKDALIVNLIKMVISAPFGNARGKFAKHTKTLALTLYEISKFKSSLYDDLMKNYVARKFENIDQDVLLRICPFLGSDKRIWNWLSEPDQIRIRRLLETANFDTLKENFAFDTFGIDPLSEMLLNRFDDFEENIQIDIISEYPKKEFVEKGIEIYSEARSYRHAEQLGQFILLSLADFFTSEDIGKILDATSDNNQIWHAGGTFNILENLFDRTTSLLPQSHKHWSAFIDKQIERGYEDKSDHYAYSGLQERLDKLIEL